MEAVTKFLDPTAGTPSNPIFDFHLGGNSTVVMSDYHICRYDTLLGVIVCVGDDADVLVLGKEMCREMIPLRKGTHWLDCFVYAGTSTFLVLSSDSLVCMDYSNRVGDSVLTPDGGAPFTSLYVPKGLTVGVVGRKDGTVSYFRLNPVSNNPGDRPQLFWTTVDINVLSFCQPFLKTPLAVDTSAEAHSKFLSWGSVVSIDSYPDNPNAFVAVIAGVSGVCKWYLDEARLSCFFDASTLAGTSDELLATCRVSPGGNYVCATTVFSSKLLVWSETKKKKNKSCELYWCIDLSESINPNRGTLDSFWYNEYSVGIHMARTALEQGFHSTNDKHSQMFLLLHGQHDILEVVIRLDDKKVIRQDKIIAHLTAYTASKGTEAAKSESTAARANSLVDNYYKVFNVEPCMISNYWGNGLTDVDLEALFVTSEGGLRPILAKRNRQTGGLESIKELRELSATVPWHPRALLLRLPETQLRQLAQQIKSTPISSTWERLLRGGSTILQQMEAAGDQSAVQPGNELWRKVVMVTVTDAAQAMCLSPQSNETFAMHPRALQKCVPWVALAMEQDPSSLVLEAALPSMDSAFLPTELIVRVYSNESILTVMKNDIRRNTGSFVLNLNREALQLEGEGTKGTRMIRQCSIINARLSPSTVSSKMTVGSEGKSLFAVLEDGGVAIVDLSGAKNEDGQPHMILIPSALMPMGTKVLSVEAFWLPNPKLNDGELMLAYLFGEGKGFLLWNVSAMRMIAYSYPPYAAKAKRLCVTTASIPPPPNMSGDIMKFEVSLTLPAQPAEQGEYGTVNCYDALGAILLSFSLGYGLVEQSPSLWCYHISKGDGTEWKPLAGFSGAVVQREITLQIEVQGSNSFVWSVSSSGITCSCENPFISSGSIVDVKAEWTCGKAELSYATPLGEEVSYALKQNRTSQSIMAVSPTLAFVSDEEIVIVDVTSLFEGNNTGNKAPTATPAVSRLDGSRTLEHFSVYHARGSVIVITRDVNGWRWLNILDSRTAKPRMESYATLDFAGEDKIQVLTVEIENVLHLYFLGSNNGVVGHFFIEANLGSAKDTSIKVRGCFNDRTRFAPVPSTFRGYSRFLPPPITLKQETGFFKRLMTLPWEDIALKLESETLRSVKPSKGTGAQMPPPSQTAASPPSSPAVSKAQQNEKERAAIAEAERKQLTASTPSAPPPRAVPPPSSSSSPSANAAPAPEEKGSRYAQLKAIAERENVSLTEARRMMSENIRKLQVRTEKLQEMGERSAELASTALTFQDLARQLKEKQRSSWL
ncbi:hypothetical protein AGDE_08814 [Angomonas deanei]|nr:hypothetical protein AGDE_08814 [Angomonas deanei]|eukprot:EPY32195.1 hypothetical protein AGDE_08814 [Angomonas deanei]